MADDLRAPGESYDASDETQIKKRDLELKRREQSWRDALQDLLKTPPGRNWMWNVLSEADIFRTSFVAGDSHASAFNEGKRALGLRLLADIQRLAPDAFFLMSRENGGK